QEIGLPNMVTSVLASYRGFDTLGETAVVFAAAIGVLSLLGLPKRERAAIESGLESHLVLQVVAKIIIPLIILFALYVQFHGDYGPGGGFQAGVIAAAAIILYALVFGLPVATQVLQPGLLKALAALGVLIYAGTGVASFFLGGNFLDYNVLASNPVAGQHLGIILIELGVGITVFAAMLSIFYAFASKAERKNIQ
ncbi:MAG: Na(+)/H(+) antiporter subunit B, partial [Gammaproteobacteria bacterium]|nr:Na(+)/H(+) antiporter subunit B [Gammaproteobacteria bacterium]